MAPESIAFCIASLSSCPSSAFAPNCYGRAHVFGASQGAAGVSFIGKFNFAFDNPHYYRLMFQLEDADLICKYAEVSQTPPQCFDFIRQAVAEAREQRLFIADRSIEAVSHAIWASIHGAAALKLSGMLDFKLPQEAREEFFETLIENTINGQRPCA